MSSMFKDCYSFSSLTDISRLDIQNVNNMSNMFNGCFNLTSLPDISRWDTQNVTNMESMFFIVLHYHHYQIFLNGILKMLLI